MSHIVSVVNELANIRKELGSLRGQVRALNLRKAQLENEVLQFTQAKEQTGLKYKDLKIEAEEKEVYKRLKKTEKEQSMMETLRQYGVHDTDRAYQDLMRSMRGEAEHKLKVRIKSTKM